MLHRTIRKSNLLPVRNVPPRRPASHCQKDGPTSLRLTLLPAPDWLKVREETMTYDWDGRRTRRIGAAKLMTAVVLSLSVPIAVTLWTYGS